jgi:hypothetical protein
MTRMTLNVTIVALAALALAPPALADTFAGRTWNFDGDKVDAAPAGFSFGRTGSGAQGHWVVVADKSAPSGGQALAQLDADHTDYRFPVAVADEAVPADVAASVRCKPVAGKVDRACGLVVRYQDENNYYLTRANALEGNVNFYDVKDGKRRLIKGARARITSGEWHTLAIVAKGDHFVVSWEGKPVVDAKDKTFSAGGKVGVWTKADSVTHFDDLTVSEP